MLIGEFNESFPPITDGVANVVRNYAHWITKDLSFNSRCIVVTPDVPENTDSREIFEVVRYASLPFLLRPPYRLGMPHLDAQFRTRLEAIPFDIVHAHTPFNSGLIAASYARRHGVPLVASFHTKYRDDFLPFVRSPAIADAMIREIVRFYDKADSVWTVSNASVDALREYGYKGPVTVIQNGTELTPADPSHRRSAACDSVCAALGLRDGTPVFLYVGQHVWQKNLRLLVESLALVRDGLLRARRNPGPDGGPSFHMLFVGGGDAAKELEELVESHGLSQETRFLGVVRDREILRGLFERSDLFLFPSKYDTSALVIRESAAALCPTVFIEGSTVSEGVEDGVNGYLADDTPQSFAKRILAVLEDPEALKRTGTGAQRDFHRSWTTVAGEVMGQYREILARFGSEPARPVQKRSTMRAADATKRKAVRADQASKKKAEGSGRQRKRSGSIVPSSETSTPSDESSAS